MSNQIEIIGEITEGTEYTAEITGAVEYIAEIQGYSTGAVAWGEISGTLSNQTDLWTALNTIDIGVQTDLGVKDTATIDAVLTNSIISANLKDTAVTAGSYTSANITIDAQGRITLASNGSGGVASVNTYTGVVVLDTDDLLEGTNKYVTASDITKLGNISVTQAVDLDTMESDIATNNAKVSDKTVAFTGGTNVTIGGTYPNFTITDNSGTSDLALGETLSTAYRGDRGKTAYDHSQLVSGNPHAVTKSDVGLGNVDDKQQVNLTDIQTIGGVKTFTSSPIVPTPTTNYQAATKIYVDGLVEGGVTYKGTFGSAGSTTGGDLPGSPTQGDLYICDEDGYVSVEASATFNTGDSALFDGTIWNKMDASDAVSSVFGRVGSVVATSGDYSASQVTNAFDKSADTTNDITDTATNRFTNDTDITRLTNTSGSNTGDQAASDFAHNSLTGLNDGTDYEHITQTQKNALHPAVTIDTANGLSLSTQALSLALASTSTTGALSDTDWDTFNNKVTNATHTGDADGNTVLTLNKVAITGKDIATAVDTDYILISDTNDSGNLKKALISDIDGLVTSVNTHSGEVVLDPDDLDDTLTTNKFVTAADITVLGDTSGTNTGDITKVTENITLDATDISNKYVGLSNTPLDNTAVGVFPRGGIKQQYTTDFTVITDGVSIKRLNWNGLTLESLLSEGDIVSVDYIY